MSLFLLITLAAVAGLSSTARAAAPETVTVVTLNLWHDQSEWPKRMARILREVRALNPDVLCLQEVLQHATLPNQALALAESLGYQSHFVSVDPEGAPKRYGNAILTRHPVLARGGKSLEPMNDYRVVAHVRIDLHGRPFDIYDTHLHHTHEGGAIRATQIRDLLAFIDSTRGKGAYLLAGDFNAPLESPEMAPLRAACLDAFACANPGVAGAEAATMNPLYEKEPRAIDHIFVPRRGKPSLRVQAASVLFREKDADGVWASDHFGVLGRLIRAQ